MSRDNVLFCLEALASIDPNDIDCDNIEVHFDVEGRDSSVNMSITKIAQMAVDYMKEMR